MRLLLVHLIVAFAATWLTGHYTIADTGLPLVFLGLVTGYFILLWLASYFFNRRYFHKIPLLGRYILFIIKELTISNLRIAYDVVTPKLYINPAIIAIPLDAKTDREIVTLATLITFTPGTLSLDVSEDRKTLYVHEMYIQGNDAEAAKQSIKEGFERRLLALTR